MKKHIVLASVAIVVVLGLTGFFLQAEFIQCLGGAGCDGTNNPDVINGSQNSDEITGGLGADILFGNDDQDLLEAGAGDDVSFGGLGSDILADDLGNDILLAGPDEPNFGQSVIGGPDNDTINVLVGDVSECLIIDGQTGQDVVNLIGFGPYSAISPFGQTFAGDNFVHLVDPIAGGNIFIYVVENGDIGTETINGLLSPDVAIIPVAAPIAEACFTSIPPIE